MQFFLKAKNPEISEGKVIDYIQRIHYEYSSTDQQANLLKVQIEYQLKDKHVAV